MSKYNWVEESQANGVRRFFSETEDGGKYYASFKVDSGFTLEEALKFADIRVDEIRREKGESKGGRYTPVKYTEV